MSIFKPNSGYIWVRHPDQFVASILYTNSLKQQKQQTIRCVQGTYYKRVKVDD